VILLEIALIFSIMSMISVGGLPAVMGEVQRIVVDQKAWVTAPEFVQLYALGQAAPGPNVLVVSLIGWKVAGLLGALVALLAMCTPAAVMTYWVSDVWDRFKDTAWRGILQRAMSPLVVGLVAAGGFVLATPGAPDWRMWLIAALSTCGMLFLKKLNPLWLLAAGGALGAVLL
jgi:chromate transporter